MSQAPYVHLDQPLTGRRRGDRVTLPPAAAHHLARVLRLGPGAEVEVADGRGSSAPGALAGDTVVLVDDPVTAPLPTPTLRVAQALPKGRKLDEVVRQVTELGVDAIVPVAAARCVTRLDGDRAARAVERWTSVAWAAAEQARRPHRATVAPVVDPDELAAGRSHDHRLLVAHVGAEVPLAAAARQAAGAARITVAVGPEGGWTDHEVARFAAAGADLVGLGPSVLRTEHAAAAAVAGLAVLTGRWG